MQTMQAQQAHAQKPADVETRPPEPAQKTPESAHATEPAADIDALLLRNLGESPGSLAPAESSTNPVVERQLNVQAPQTPPASTVPVQPEVEAETAQPEQSPASIIERAKATIRRALVAAKSDKQHNDSYDLMPVAAEEVAEAAEHGIDIAGYRHVIDGSAIRHTFKNHGNAQAEQVRGQVPITDADLESIPDILNAPDRTVYGLKNGIGRDMVVYLKKMADGTTVYLEEVRTKRRTLAAQSMRKYPLTTSAASVEKALRPTSETLQGDETRIVETPKARNFQTAPSDVAAGRATETATSQAASTARNVQAPPASGDLFAPATQADHIRAAREAKDQARNTSEGRTDMLAGEGELFAGPRPEQGSFSRRPQGDGDPVIRLTGKEIGSSLSAGTVVEQAREWFKANLQGSIVKRNGLSPVRISGKGWNKVKRGLTTDLDKARLIPAIPAIIRSGHYLGRFPIDKARTDDIVAFHHFQAPVNLAGQQVMAGVSVAEDSFGNLFYNLNRDPQALLEKKKGPTFTQEKARGAEPLEGEITFSRTMGDSDAEVNLEIEYPPSVLARANPDETGIRPQAGMSERVRQALASVKETDPAALQRVQTLVDTVRKGWTNAPEIVIATDMHDDRLPAAIRKADAEQRRQGASGEVDGVYWQGKVYLIASHLKTDADVARVMFHEILGHHGLRGAFGEALNPLLDELTKERSKDVAAKREEYGLPDTPEGRRLAAEEVLASMAESAPSSVPLPPSAIGYARWG